MGQPNFASVEQLWEAAAPQFPEFTPIEQRVGIALLRELAGGEPVNTAELAERLDTSTEEVETLLRESSLKRLIHWSEDGSALGFWGLSTVETPHRLHLKDRTVWSWCAADLLYLPRLLDQRAEVESIDPQTREPVGLTVSPTAIESAEPSEVVVSTSSPERWETTSAEKIIASACHFIFFFASAESGRSWVAEHPRTMLISLEDAFEWGHRHNTRMFGEVLRAEDLGELRL